MKDDFSDNPSSSSEYLIPLVEPQKKGSISIKTAFILGFLGFFFIFIANFSCFRDQYLFSGKSIETEAEIVRTQIVGVETSGGGRNSLPKTLKVRKVDYVYQLEDGRKFEGTGYLTGSRKNVEEGESISIEYIKTNPEVSRITGDKGDPSREKPNSTLTGYGTLIGVILVMLGFIGFLTQDK